MVAWVVVAGGWTMKTSRFHGRFVSVFVLLMLQLGVAWSTATVVTVPLLAPLRRHPDGYRALLSHGGRVALEVLTQQYNALTMATALVALVVLVYAGLWFVMGGTLPVLATVQPTPPLHRAVAYSVRRLPTFLGLGALSLCGYALAAGSGAMVWSQLHKHTATWMDPRAQFTYEARSLVVVVVFAALVTAWHDLARVCAVATGRGVLSSAGAGMRWMLRSPVRTLGTGALYACISMIAVLIAMMASRFWGSSAHVAATVALVVTQQLALVWRFVWRARWFFFLGSMLRENQTSPEESSEQA
jgi:hypothetical protein